MIDHSLRLDALLYAQRALLNLVPSDLRAVEIAWDDSRSKVHMRCVVDAVKASDTTWELMNQAHSHLVADMPETTEVTWEVEERPAPSDRVLAHGGVWAFMRYEPDQEDR